MSIVDDFLMPVEILMLMKTLILFQSNTHKDFDSVVIEEISQDDTDDEC
jgi:hypothetical protein